jgi:hypothetical protein
MTFHERERGNRTAEFKNTHCRASLKSNLGSVAANCSKNPNLQRYAGFQGHSTGLPESRSLGAFSSRASIIAGGTAARN